MMPRCPGSKYDLLLRSTLHYHEGGLTLRMPVAFQISCRLPPGQKWMGSSSRYPKYLMVMSKIETADAKHPVSHLWPRNFDGSFSGSSYIPHHHALSSAQKSSSCRFDLSILTSLYGLGFYISEKGHVHPTEAAHTRSPWRKRIQASCRWRVLMAMYYFEGMYHK